MDKYDQKRLLHAINRTMSVIEREKISCNEIEKKYMLSVQKEMKLALKHTIKTNVFNY